MKFALSGLLLAACLVFAPLPANAATSLPPGCVYYGDSNLDGVYNLDDLYLLMDWLDGVPPPMPVNGTLTFIATDVNLDQRIDWNDFFLYLDVLNGFSKQFPNGNTSCNLFFPFAGYDWQVYDVSTYAVPNPYVPRTPDDVTHTEAEVGINSLDEYVFRGIKTTREIPEAAVTFTIEMWQTGVFHWQSFPFDVVLPHVQLAYFNWDKRWYLDVVSQTGDTVRQLYNLTPGGAVLNAHYFARFEYNPSTHMLAVAFRKESDPYLEIFRGMAYWGVSGMDSHGEPRLPGQRVSKIFLLSSDGHGTAHYRITCQGSGCPTPPTSDPTPPLVSASVAGAVGANGWYTSAVAITWNMSDSESGIASSTGCGTATVTTNTAGTPFTCTATNGSGLSTTSSITVKVDRDPPAVVPSITGTLGLNGWYVSDVNVTWSTSDSMSGVAGTTGCAPATLSGNTPGSTLSCTATNGAGLATTATVTVKIDKSPAAVTSNLLAVVAGLPGVEPGLKISLTAKLQNVLESLARGNRNAARNQLSAFINEVEAQRGKKLSDADADFLIQQARNAIAAMV